MPAQRLCVADAEKRDGNFHTRSTSLELSEETERTDNKTTRMAKSNHTISTFVRKESGEVNYMNVGGGQPLSAAYFTPAFKAEYAVHVGTDNFYGGNGDFAHQRTRVLDENTTEFTYISRDGYVRVVAVQKLYDGLYTQTCTVTNLSEGELCLKQLYNNFPAVDARLLKGDYATEAEIGVLHNDWGAEGQLFWHAPHELGAIHPTGHVTCYSTEITSLTAWSTKRYMPVVFVRDKVTGHVWFVQHLPDGPYSIEVGLTDTEPYDGSCFDIAVGAGTNERHGFRLYLKSGESYTCCESAHGCAATLDEAIANLTYWRRKSLLRRKRAPVMFNDYMNCIWVRQHNPDCISLIDTAKAMGVDGFCFDDGWYLDGPGKGMGGWYPSDKQFCGRSFAEMVSYIREKGMIAGLWTELECCSRENEASRFPDECFLQNEGHRIYRSGRLYFNFANEQVRAHLTSRIADLYDLGIRYIKNDYNGHPGAGVDWAGASPLAGLEQHVRAVNSFYKELGERFPDLYIESCASGAMRSDGQTNCNFCQQSISDCEEYYKLPSIVAGTMLSLVPEQIGVWSYPYPKDFWSMDSDAYLTDAYRKEMADGEQTAFNMITCVLCSPYLSGKIDRADEKNLGLVQKGVEIHRALRPFIAEATPIFPLPHRHIFDKAYSAFGLRKDDLAYVAVFRTGAEENKVLLPLACVESAEEIYPCLGAKAEKVPDGIRVSFTKPVQAILMKVKFKNCAGRKE